MNIPLGIKAGLDDLWGKWSQIQYAYWDVSSPIRQDLRDSSKSMAIGSLSIR